METHAPLTEKDLFPTGPLQRLGRRVFVHDTIGSTNAFLLERAAKTPDGAVAWAEFQSAGRGRLGRQWDAPRGSSILLSVLLLEPANSPILSQGGLVAALSACEAIEAVTECAPTIRWPNDIAVDGRKLGGVLAETCAVPAAAHVKRKALVVGVGINCLQQRGHFSAELADKATSLELECHHPVERARIAAGLLARLDHWLVASAQPPDGWALAWAAWRARCADVGSRVKLQHDGRAFAGTAVEISPEGDLIVELEQGGRRDFPAATTTRVWE